MIHAIRKEEFCIQMENIFPVISSSPVIHSPNLSTCHRCGIGFQINGSLNGLKILESNWRVVLLCQECFNLVRSAHICSYCFFSFTQLENKLLDCNICTRRVHRACVSQHHRNFSFSLFDSGNFICIDCCPIRKLGRESFSDRSGFRVSVKPIAEKKTIAKFKSREKVRVAKRSSGLKRKAFDAIEFVKERSCINLTVPDEKMALCLHRRINGSKRVSRNSVVKLGYDSNSMAHHGKIEVCVEDKSNLEGRGKSELISTNRTLFEENGDLMKEIRGCDIGSFKFIDSADCRSNVGLEFLPCNSFHTSLMNTIPLKKFRFCDFDGEGSSGLQRKSVDAINENGFLKKYFRKSLGSGRSMRADFHSVLSDSLLLKLENGDLMKQDMVFNTSCPRDFFLQEKEKPLKFQDSIVNINSGNFTFLSCLSLNTCLESTMPATKYIFTGCDKMGHSKTQQKNVDVIDPGRPLKNYFRKLWDYGRIMEGNSYSILANSQLFKRKKRFLMKQNRLCFTGSPKFSDSIDDLNNGGPASSPCHTLNACSDSSMALTKDIFCYGNGKGSFKLQRKSIDAITFHSMKKYFRKRWSRKKVMIGNSESVLVDSLLFKESEDLSKQIKGYNTVNIGDEGRSKELQRKPIDAIVSDNMKKYYRKRRDSKRVRPCDSQTISANSSPFELENVDLMKKTIGCSTSCLGDVCLKNDISPNFLVSTDDENNVDSPLLQYLGLNTFSNSKMSLIKYRFGDGDEEECSKLHRKSIDRLDSDGSLKKYFRKRLGFQRNMQRE